MLEVLKPLFRFMEADDLLSQQIPTNAIQPFQHPVHSIFCVVDYCASYRLSSLKSSVQTFLALFESLDVLVYKQIE